VKTKRVVVKAGAALVALAAKKLAARGMARMAVAVDDALVNAGKAAKRRRAKRAAKAALRAAGKAALIAGTVIAVRRLRARRTAALND
jgi:hypothetical protein